MVACHSCSDSVVSRSFLDCDYMIQFFAAIRFDYEICCRYASFKVIILKRGIIPIMKFQNAVYICSIKFLTKWYVFFQHRQPTQYQVAVVSHNGPVVMVLALSCLSAATGQHIIVQMDPMNTIVVRNNVFWLSFVTAANTMYYGGVAIVICGHNYACVNVHGTYSILYHCKPWQSTYLFWFFSTRCVLFCPSFKLQNHERIFRRWAGRLMLTLILLATGRSSSCTLLLLVLLILLAWGEQW